MVFNGQFLQLGSLTLQTLAPKSINASVKSPGLSRDIKLLINNLISTFLILCLL